MRDAFVQLALPPVGLVLLLVLGMLLRGRWMRFGRRLCWAALGLLVIFGMPAVSYPMLIALESDLPMTPPSDNPPQAIVILGGEVIRAHNETLGIRPGLLTLDRLRTGAALARKTKLPILVTGGTGQTNVSPVAAVMALSLKEDFQTPATWVESRSLNTWQNAHLSAEILKAQGITSIYLVTHSWHMRRALLSFRDTGLTVTAAPTSLDDALGPTWTDFIPRANVWQAGYFAMHEWIGYVWYSRH